MLTLVLNIMFGLVLSLGLLVGILMLVLRRKPVKQPTSVHIGKPPGLPLIGNLFDLVPANMLNSVYKHTKKYGKILEMGAFNKRMYFVSDIHVCREMSMKRPKVFRRPVTLDYSAMKMGFSNGLFHTHGPQWNRLRKLTSPPLARHHITQNVEEMCKEAMNMVDRISTMANGVTEVDAKREMFLYTLHVIIQGAFGIELTGEYAEYFFGTSFCQDLLEVFHFMMESTVFPAPYWVWRMIPHYANIERRSLEADGRYTAMFQKIISQKRKELAEHPETSNKHSVIDIMISKETSDIAEGAEVTDDEILANVKTFFAAGSETTSVALSWALYFLTQHPDILQEARAEVAPFFAVRHLLSVDQLWSALGAARMPLCHAIVKETLRMHSPAAQNFYQLEQEHSQYTLSNGMVILPSDIVVLNYDCIHWNPEYFEGGKVFAPKRWLIQDQKALERMESAFFAFGGGTRACPGQSLALVEAVVGLSALIHHLDFQLACPIEEVKRLITFTAQPTKMPMRFTRRNV